MDRAEEAIRGLASKGKEIGWNIEGKPSKCNL